MSGITLLVMALIAGVGLGLRSRPSAEPPATGWSIHWVAGSRTIVDHSGTRWTADRGAIGGRVIGSTTTASAASSSPLLGSSRLGATGYRIRVPGPGRYAVALTFVEQQHRQPGQRVFTVQADGTTEASDVDVAGQVGQDRPDNLLFVVAVNSTILTIHFVPVVGTPTVSDLAVALQDPVPRPRTVLDEQFAGPAGHPPDPTLWKPTVGGGGWGNRELEDYTDRPANLALDGHGDLALTARRTAQGYTSARVSTVGRRAFQYGQLAAEISIPAGAGLWPAFWAVGSDGPTVGWPSSGEIDVMEGNGAAPHRALGTAIGRDGPGLSHYSAQRAFTSAEPLTSGFHTYAVLWTPLGVAFSVDGIRYFTLLRQDLAAGSAYPFNHPFSLVLDLAVGGNEVGAPTPATPFPARMLIRNVTVTD